LDNGVTKPEISEVILHTTIYAGWPVGTNAVRIAKEVFDDRARWVRFPRTPARQL